MLAPSALACTISVNLLRDNPGVDKTVTEEINLQSPVASEMVYVPEGNFQMGCNLANNHGYSCLSLQNFELPVHTVFLDAYYIDKTEVTTAQYAQCVVAGACEPPQNIYTGWGIFNKEYFGNPFYADYPVKSVTWDQAREYCQWMGKRLPTEAEWEKAARGANDTRAYPWGDQEPDCTFANIAIGYNQDCVGKPSKVGSYTLGASPYGVLDMAGNVSEWVNDWFGSNYYCAGPKATTDVEIDEHFNYSRSWNYCNEEPPYLSPWQNPPGPVTGTYKVLRGGDWDSYNHGLYVHYRGYVSVDWSTLQIGFRCANSP
jgi:formylglycine-generating enzyme required for sulfatase activity